MVQATARLHKEILDVEAAIEELRLLRRESAAQENYPQDFVHKNEMVTLESGRTLRVDDILHGYDKLYETKRLYAGPSWLGVQCQQDPSDAFVIQMLVWKLKPSVIVDIGTNAGGSALFFASLMHYYAKPGEAVIITIDPWPLRNWDKQSADKLCKTCDAKPTDYQIWKDYVHIVKGFSTAPDVLQQVQSIIANFTGRGPVLVNVDGEHRSEVVLKDLQSYAKIVSVGSYMIVQDTKLDRLLFRNKGGPLTAVRQFMQQSPYNESFLVDRSWEEYFYYTQHSEGYLKRLK